MDPWDAVECPGRAVPSDDEVEYLEYPVKIEDLDPFPLVEKGGGFGGELGEGYCEDDDED